MSVDILARHRAMQLCSAAMLAAVTAMATSAAQAQSTESVVVTGSRLPSTYQAPTPVTVVSVSALESMSPGTMVDGLIEIPAFKSSERSQTAGTGTTGSAGSAFLNLRGLVCILHGDSHMLAADDGSNADYATGGGAPLPVMCGGPLDQNPSIKAARTARGFIVSGIKMGKAASAC